MISTPSWDRSTGNQPRPSPKRKQPEDIISSDEDLKEVWTPHNDDVVASLTIAKHYIKRILIDNGGFVDVLFYTAYQKMRLPSDLLKSASDPLIEFLEEAMSILGKVALLVTTG